ncbi:MAG: DUF3566 domain-containing protein [Scardovia wiggsiae]|nr:DUF3566 domain-containing protein [Scardovia wiggsiae]
MTAETPQPQDPWYDARQDASAQQMADPNAETQYTTRDAQEVAARSAARPAANAGGHARASQQPGDTGRAGSPSSAGTGSGVPRARRMNLSITRVDPWSVTKMAFMLSIAGAIIQLVAVTLIWFIVDAVGLFDVVNELGTRISSSFNLTDILSLPRVIGAITILSVFEIVIICVMAAIGALLYNVSSRLVGGIHVTLGDD